LPIKNLLMDQRVLGGVGNIYANEMLFQAGIRPRRRAATLRRAELERLSVAMRSVLLEAVELGGSSISDYRDANGQRGFFQMHHAVYDRTGEPCRVCAASIKRIVLSGRSSFYCPRCHVEKRTGPSIDAPAEGSFLLRPPWLRRRASCPATATRRAFEALGYLDSGGSDVAR
jgi:ribosomal protein S13